MSTYLRDRTVEDVRFAHLLDFVGELEIFEDATDVCGEAVNVADKVLVDVVGVPLQLLEREGRVVVKALTGSVIQDLIEGVIAELTASAPLELCQNFALRWSKHAI